MRSDFSAFAAMGDRTCAWLHQAYPHDGAKLAARDFNVSPHTTKKWFSGMHPSNEHLAAMASRWGKQFVAFVMEPLVGPWDAYAIQEELHAIHAQLNSIESKFAGEVVRGDSSALSRPDGAEARPLGRPLAP